MNDPRESGSCLFCLFGVFRPTPTFVPIPLLICRRHLCRWRATKFDVCSPIEQRGFFSVHIYCDTEHPFIMVISKDPWHSHLLSSMWQWSCHLQGKDLTHCATAAASCSCAGDWTLAIALFFLLSLGYVSNKLDYQGKFCQNYKFHNPQGKEFVDSSDGKREGVQQEGEA